MAMPDKPAPEAGTPDTTAFVGLLLNTIQQFPGLCQLKAMHPDTTSQ